MTTFKFLTIILIFSFSTNAQIKFLGEGRCEGTQNSQADLDLLFVNAPDITWLDIKYTDSTLLLPNLTHFVEPLAPNLFQLHSMPVLELQIR